MAESIEPGGSAAAGGAHQSSRKDPISDHLPGLLDEIQELMAERHRKYGKGNISKHGIPGILVRLDDKLARLENSKDDFTDESYEDAFKDLIGYALIAILIQREQWEHGTNL